MFNSICVSPNSVYYGSTAYWHWYHLGRTKKSRAVRSKAAQLNGRGISSECEAETEREVDTEITQGG